MYQQKWRVFIGIVFLSFSCYLDYTVVNVALPTIQQKLDANLITLQWVMNIYFLALCVLATIMGRCGDIFGRRRLFYVGAAIFGIASVIAGLAPSITWLIIGRFLQGIGAAIVLPLGPSLLPQSFPENERAKVIAWLGSVGGIALALGPVIGGYIVSYWGWHWIFFINIPIILVGYLFCFGAVKESAVLEGKQSLDWLGMLLLALTIGGIVLSLIHSEAAGWGNTITLIYLAVGVISGIGLIKIENRIKDPLIDFKDFRKLLFYSGAVLCLLAGVLSAVALFFDPLYLQILRGQSPETSGLILFIIPIAVFGVAFIVGKSINHLGLLNTILIGLSLGVLAALLQIFFTSSVPFGYILIAFFILGSLWAMGNTVSIIAAQASVEPERASVATGTIVTMFNLGGSIGLAIAVVVYHYVSFHALHLFMQQHQLSVQQFEFINRLMLNPAHSLQIQMTGLTQVAFNHSFMSGFSGVMFFLFIFATFLLLSVLVWKIYNKISHQSER